MSGAFPILIGLALATVVVVLVIGLVSMLKGGEFNAKYGNKLMRLRVAAQFVAVLLIGLAFLMRDG